MDEEDPITKQIYEMLQEKPRRLAELQRDIPLSQSAVLHRMNVLEISHKVIGVRNHAANNTTYRLADGE